MPQPLLLPPCGRSHHTFLPAALWSDWPPEGRGECLTKAWLILLPREKWEIRRARNGVGERGVLMGTGERENMEKDGKAERNVERDGGRERGMEHTEGAL